MHEADDHPCEGTLNTPDNEGRVIIPLNFSVNMDQDQECHSLEDFIELQSYNVWEPTSPVTAHSKTAISNIN